MKIGFVGGGSGGHFYPLIAVAEVLSAYPAKPDLYYFGPSPYNEEELAKHSIKHVSCPAGKLRRYFSLQNFIDLFRTFFGFFIALWKLYVIYPDVIFSKGGYTSVPILIAARLLRIPIVIHESDAVPGRANKLAMKFARYIGIAYDDVAQFFPPEKTALVGIPLRQSVRTINQDPFTTLGMPNDKPLIYITGGSLGADRLNDVALEILDELLPNYRIFHQTGSVHYDKLSQTANALLAGNPYRENYYIQGSISGEMISNLYDAASIVVTRAGSTTLFEIAAHSRPAIIVPIPEKISHDQRTNAYAYAGNGAAVVIEEKNLTSFHFVESVLSLLRNKNKLDQMAQQTKSLSKPEATTAIVDQILQLIQ